MNVLFNSFTFISLSKWIRTFPLGMHYFYFISFYLFLFFLLFIHFKMYGNHQNTREKHFVCRENKINYCPILKNNLSNMWKKPSKWKKEGMPTKITLNGKVTQRQIYERRNISKPGEIIVISLFTSVIENKNRLESNKFHFVWRLRHLSWFSLQITNSPFPTQF